MNKSVKYSLVNAAKLNPPSRFLDYRDFLKNCYLHVKKDVGKYSYHQFSKDLGFHNQTQAYMIISENRNLTGNHIETLRNVFSLSKFEERYLQSLVEYADAKSDHRREKAFAALLELKTNQKRDHGQQQEFEFLTHWHHSAIFELLNDPVLDQSPAAIEKSLIYRVTKKQIVDSLELLSKLQLIEFDQQTKRYIRIKKNFTTEKEVEGFAVLGYHLQMLNLAKSSLSKTNHKDREISTLTLNLSSEAKDKVKLLLAEVSDYIMYLAETDQQQESNEVHQLNFQLFPLTNKSSR